MKTTEVPLKPRPVRPHVVVLGAGASRAALPNGDASGHPIPLMQDLAEVVGIATRLEEEGIEWRHADFEALWSLLSANPSHKDLCRELEESVFSYFSSLSLPSQPTLYDHLILSLRPKDAIVTYNWDPFLIQAYRRNYTHIPALPQLFFLHGNVLAAFCETDQVIGVRGGICSRCRNPFSPTRLLYPVAQKDYSTDPTIRASWAAVRHLLRDALWMTIFGYRAPQTDAEAVNLMSNAWGTPAKRQFEQVELIDIRDEEELRSQWSVFIHTHHYEVHRRFYDAWITQHPRRTIEAFLAEFIEANLLDPSPPFPAQASFEELWEWARQMVAAEAES